MCAIADAYDAMLCGLGGRQRRTMAEALDEIRRGSGTQFDPELVVSFECMIRSESQDLGLDLNASAGMEHFQELVESLKEDKGFI
jgi:putative two-component system response regulator